MKYLTIILIVILGCNSENKLENNYPINSVNQLQETLTNNNSKKVSFDTDVLSYIDSLGNYVLFTDFENIPTNIKSYYSIINDYFKLHNNGLNQYFIKVDDINLKSDTLSIPIYSYDGFIKRKKNEDINRKAEQDSKEGDSVQIIMTLGNYGSDGNIKIDTRYQHIIGFFLWC